MKPPSIDDLRRVTQPDSVLGRRSEEHWTGAYMRRLSPYVTRLALRLGMSADAVTVTMLVVGLTGAGLLFVGGLWPAVAAAGGVQLYLLLDCVDGEVARWNRTESARGVYLDRISHYLVEGALFTGLGWRAGGGESTAWLAVGLGGALAVILGRIETDLVDAARAKAGLAAIGDHGASISRPLLRAMRRMADFVPVHRFTGAAEASLLIAAAAVADRVRGDLLASRGLAVALGVIAGTVAVGHLITVLASDRLR
jgi:phosphatidylglycerophosphate synthase